MEAGILDCMLFASLSVCLHTWPIDVPGDLCRDSYRKEHCCLTLRSSFFDLQKRIFSVNLRSGFVPRQAPVPWNPPLAGPQEPEGRCRGLSSPPLRLGGGVKGRQSPSDPREVTLGFGRLSQRSTDPGALSAEWQTSDKRICWKPHWGNFADFPVACPDFPTWVADLAQAMWAVWFQNALCHKFHQRWKHCGSDSRLWTTHIASFACQNLFDFSSFSVFFSFTPSINQCIKHACAWRETCSTLD